MTTGKTKTLAQLAGIVEDEQSSGRKVGFTNGCFDILHLGHIRYLREAKNNCDILIIGVNSDESVKRLKGESRPLTDVRARSEVLSALECVDYVTVFGEDTPEDLIKALSPDVLFKGGDWKEEDIAGAGYVKENGGKVMVIPYLEGYSTTGLIERIKKDG